MKRKEETAVNHGGEIFKQTKPSIIEETMMPPLTRPRSFEPIKPETYSIAPEDKTDMKQSGAKKIMKDKKIKSKKEHTSIANSTILASSNQAPLPVVEVMM